MPQGGSLSAQLVSIYCMWREAKRPSPICRALPSLRYRDNFLFLISPEWSARVFHNTRAFRRLVRIKRRGESCAQYKRNCLPLVQKDPRVLQTMVTDKLIKHLEAIYKPGVQYEQAGSTINFLTSRLSVREEVWSPLAWKSSLRNSGAKAPPPLSNWLDVWALNAPKMLQSTIPNSVKQSQHFRLNTYAVHENLSLLVKSLNMKPYPPAWHTNGGKTHWYVAAENGESRTPYERSYAVRGTGHTKKPSPYRPLGCPSSQVTAALHSRLYFCILSKIRPCCLHQR